MVSQFMAANNSSVDQTKYAVAEMLQLIWRGCIRDGQPMSVYIVCPKMRKLFKDWLFNAGVWTEQLTLDKAS